MKTPLRIPNAPGTIDCGYRDEVNVIVYNDSFMVEEEVSEPLTLDSKGCIHGTYKIRKGDRIAQLVIMPYLQVYFEEAAELDETERGAGGFGSTGT